MVSAVFMSVWRESNRSARRGQMLGMRLTWLPPQVEMRPGDYFFGEDGVVPTTTVNSAPLPMCRTRTVVPSVETSNVSDARGKVVYCGGGLDLVDSPPLC